MKAPLAARMDSGDTGRAMSQENVEIAQIVRDGYDAFNRGDLEAALAPLDPAT